MATTSILEGQTFPFTSTAPNVSNPFNLPTMSTSIPAVISVSASYVTGATGTVVVTQSTDGGSTFSAATLLTGSASSITAAGQTISFLQQPNTVYRIERTDGSGSVTATVSSLISGTITKTTQAASIPPFSLPLLSSRSVPMIYASAVFSGGAAGTVTLTASTDGGQTFNPVVEAGTTLPALASANGGLINFLQQPNTIYRLEFNFTSFGTNNAGVANYTVGVGSDVGPANVVTLSAVNMQGSSYGMPSVATVDSGSITAAQVQKLYDAIRVPLTDSGIAGALTAYKSCTYGTLNGDGSYTPAGTAIATISIPSAAQRARQRHAVIGLDRQIRAEYADVVSVVDENGNSLSVAYSTLDPPKAGYTGTRYVPGQRTTSANLAPFNPSTGNFTDATNTSGIQCFATLIEAATCGPQFGKAGENHRPNLTTLAA